MSFTMARVSIALLSAALCAPAVMAQAEQTPEHILDDESPAAEPAAGADGAPDEAAETDALSNEVDFNEDNFRRSMELRDRNLQRSPDLTTGSYSTGTGLKALDELPEASQKHLREQLREVIVENGPWSPEDAGEAYPYVPSAEAMRNGVLAKREEAAWGELVARYHEREASIHGNGPLSHAANAGSGPSSDASSKAGQTDGKGQDSAAKGSEDSARAERAAALARMMESDVTPNSGSAGEAAEQAEQGVSQNALELLTKRQQIPAAAESQVAPAAAGQAAESGSGATSEDESELDLMSEGIIAIDDLRNVVVDPRQAEDSDQP